MKRLCCPNAKCSSQAKAASEMIIRSGFYSTRWGKRQRFRCKGCGRTFCQNRGTVYHRLQHRRATFDEVAALSVEGMNKSSIARVKQIAWNTVARWLEKAADSCRRFNDQEIAGFTVVELEADELRETEHIIHRTAESHDPTGLGVSWPANDLSRAMESASRGSP